MNWLQHVEKWKDCTRCPLGHQRFRICIARGTVPCDVLFVGEAPGATEDAWGEVFVGPAGALMDQIIERGVPDNLTYALTNLVLCFPREAKEAGINKPKDDEILECRPRLIEFVNIAQPRLIVAVGVLAHKWLPEDASVPVVKILHPAYILARMPRAQQGFASQKCAVQIHSAVQKMLEQPVQPWERWGEHAAKTRRQQIEQTYTSAEDEWEYPSDRWLGRDDEIPF